MASDCAICYDSAVILIEHLLKGCDIFAEPPKSLIIVFWRGGVLLLENVQTPLADEDCGLSRCRALLSSRFCTPARVVAMSKFSFVLNRF